MMAGPFRSIRFGASSAHGKANMLRFNFFAEQGDGDYEGAVSLTEEKGVIGEQLLKDLQRLSHANIPVDITFTQGVEVLGLN
jgi:hypothetical protein